MLKGKTGNHDEEQAQLRIRGIHLFFKERKAQSATRTEREEKRSISLRYDMSLV